MPVACFKLSVRQWMGTTYLADPGHTGVQLPVPWPCTFLHRRPLSEEEVDLVVVIAERVRDGEGGHKLWL